MIELNLAGMDEVRAAFARLVPETQTKVLKGLAQVAFDAAQTQADTHTQTGALFDSVRKRRDKDGGWIIDHNLQRAPYAPFVHWGTRPHEIRPRDKTVLRWPSGQGGKASFIFARFVHHPGYKGDAYLIEAADEAVRQFDTIVRSIELSL